MHAYLSRGVRRPVAAGARSSPAGRRSSSRLRPPRRGRRRRTSATPPTTAPTSVMVLLPFFSRASTDDDGVLVLYEGPPAEGACRSSVLQRLPAPSASPSPLTSLRWLCEIPELRHQGGPVRDPPPRRDLIRTGLPVMNGADPPCPHALYAAGASGWPGSGRRHLAPRTCRSPLVRAAEAAHLLGRRPRDLAVPRAGDEPDLAGRPRPVRLTPPPRSPATLPAPPPPAPRPSTRTAAGPAGRPRDPCRPRAGSGAGVTWPSRPAAPDEPRRLWLVVLLPPGPARPRSPRR